MAGGAGSRPLNHERLFIGDSAAAPAAVQDRAGLRKYAITPGCSKRSEEAASSDRQPPMSTNNECRPEIAPISLGMISRGSTLRYSDAVGRRLYLLLRVLKIGRGDGADIDRLRSRSSPIHNRRSNRLPGGPVYGVVANQGVQDRSFLGRGHHPPRTYSLLYEWVELHVELDYNQK